MIAFMRGIRTPVSMVVTPASLRISLIGSGYLASRSPMGDFTAASCPESYRPMSRLRTARVTEA